MASAWSVPLDEGRVIRHLPAIRTDQVQLIARPNKVVAHEGSCDVLRLSKLTDYAVVVLVRLASTDNVQTSPGIAAATGIPEPTVAKVLKILAASGLVSSQRGARGGYRTVRALADIPVSDVIAAIDGPIALTACVEGSAGECESQALCPMRGRWDPVNDAIQRAMAAISLADMQDFAVPAAFRVPARAAVALPAAE